MKKNLLLISTAIFAVATCKSVWASCPKGQTEDPATKHCMKIGSDCDGKCTYYYDTVTKDIRVEKNEGAEGEIIVKNQYGYSSVPGVTYIRNYTIGEGITGIGYAAIHTYANTTIGTKEGTLTFPSTIRTFGDYATYNAGFGKVVFAENTSEKKITLPLMLSGNYTVVVDPSTKLDISISHSYGTYPSKVSIECRGKISECQGAIKKGSNVTALNYSYYAGDDGNGNYEEWSDSGKTIYSDSSKSKVLGKYDFDGTQIAAYKYDGGGNLTAVYENGIATYKKTYYTPAEAAAAVKKGNNNIVTVTFK